MQLENDRHHLAADKGFRWRGANDINIGNDARFPHRNQIGPRRTPIHRMCAAPNASWEISQSGRALDVFRKMSSWVAAKSPAKSPNGGLPADIGNRAVAALHEMGCSCKVKRGILTQIVNINKVWGASSIFGGCDSEENSYLIFIAGQATDKQEAVNFPNA